MTMPQQLFPTLRKIIGAKRFADWLTWAQSLTDEFGLQQLDRGLGVLADRVGLPSVQQVYRERLLKGVRQAPSRTIKALDIVSRQQVEVSESPKLMQLSFEVLCLAKLAELADEIKLLLQSQKRSVPEAKVRLTGHECLVEVKHFEDPVMTRPAGDFFSRSITDPRLSGQSATGDQLPAHVHLRKKLSEAWKEFENTSHTVNLVFVLFFSLPDFGVSFVPALYGERFLQVHFNPWEFRLPSADKLGEDGMFADEKWHCVSGVIGVWAMRYPPFPPHQELQWSSMLFPNPKAVTPIPSEVSRKLSAGFNLLPLDILPDLLSPIFTRAEMEELYELYVRPMERQFWGRLAAVNREGEVLLGDDDVELTQEAIKRFGKSKFVLFRIGPKAVVKL